MIIELLAATPPSPQHVDTALIVGCYLAIIGVYVWTFKTVQGIRDMQFKHESKKDIHSHRDEFMRADVCMERTARMDDKINSIQDSVAEIKDGMHQGFTEIKELLKDK